ncbi:MAG TPA: PDZ domain-containing protein, partial [Puia sp.]|nr:PDZ domain-containing protein [Puia sp.]
MKKQSLRIVLFLLCCSAYPRLLFAIDTGNTRMLSQPCISGDRIAFIYAEDLWVAHADGSQPRRLTVDAGIESRPMFSPDGKLIAFSAQYDGNTDVFVVPVEGGSPRRLTWHPNPDIVRGFTPDGKSVLFASNRTTFSNRYTQLFTVPVTGGPATQLVIPNAAFACYSPDGKYIAYTPIPDAFLQWKHYRGGSIANIIIFSFADHSIVRIPQPAEGCNDTGPIWLDNKIWFRSDRNGEFNLFSYDLSSKEIRQATNFSDFPILNASGGNGAGNGSASGGTASGSGGGGAAGSGSKIIFEQAGYLHLFDPAKGSEQKLTIGIAADLLELRSRFVKGTNYIRSADISPSGARVVLDFRGEIVTAPAEKGDYRNLTLSPGVHEKYPEWSPDGRSIAYFSDASGEYQLHIRQEDGKGEPKIIKLTGSGFYAGLRWSPDSKKVSYTDNARNLYLLDLASGVLKKIDTDEFYTPGAFRAMFGDWSSDSKWIAYTQLTATQFKRVFLYSLDQQKSFPLTDGLSDATEPVFDRTGKYLYFFASTDAGPVINWFDQSNIDMRSSRSIYLVTLQQQTVSPLAKENDEEPVGAAAKKDTAAGGSAGGGAAGAGSAGVRPGGAAVAPLRIDWDGIQDRIIDLPVKAGNYAGLGVGKDGGLYYVAYPYSSDGGGAGMLHKYDFAKRKDNEIIEINGYVLSANGAKMLYVKDGTMTVANAGEKPEAGKGVVRTGDIQVKIDPAAEWPDIFYEAWRINRDYFYDPGMHGVNWEAMKKKYAVFLPDLACRTDLNTLIQWMCSELSVGHHRITDGGDRLAHPLNISGGLLGADYSTANNRYRFRKIYGGLNWNPNLRSPLTEPGINAKEGDYLLAVNGENLVATDDLYRLFENTAGKIVELTIGPNPGYEGSRIVKVVPVANEYELRNRDWVEGNLRRVNEATKGQVAYVYVPNTAAAGHDYFKRYFFPQANKKAIIVDERFNGGGSL